MSEKQAKRTRKRGHGTVETRMVDGVTQYRARVPSGVPGKKVSGDWTTDPDKADRQRIALRKQLTGGAFIPKEKITLGMRMETWLERLEKLGKPKAAVYRRRYEHHIKGSWLAERPIADIARSEIRRFLEAIRTKVVVHDGKKKPMSFQTLKSIRSAISSCVSDAMQEMDEIRANPCKGVVLEQPESLTEHVARWMTPSQQQSLWQCGAIPLPDRLILQYDTGSGLRVGEWISMPLTDLRSAVETGQQLVRYGGHHKRPPKGGKTRTIALVGLALDAAKRWLELLPSFCPHNPHNLAFPRADGARRHRSAPFGIHKGRSRWLHYQTLAGLPEQLTIHDLRHTCGASLVSGWWNRRWGLQEVRDYLGHSSIETTEKFYGHLDRSALEHAARETTGGLPTRMVPNSPQVPGATPEALQNKGVGGSRSGTCSSGTNTAKSSTYANHQSHGNTVGLSGFARGRPFAFSTPGMPLRFIDATRKEGAR